MTTRQGLIVFSALFLLIVSQEGSSTAQTTAQKTASTQANTQTAEMPPPAAKESTKKKSNNGPVSSEIGLNIPEWGIAIDAIFNPELDDLIPGYHVLNIVLTNRRGERIDLNSSLDKWIVTDRSGHKHTASNHVKNFDKKLWEQLPPKLQKLLDYPPSVNAGKSVKIDIFISKSVSLHNFKELAWRSEFFNRTFNVFTTYEDKITTPNEKEFEVPKNTAALESEFDPNNPPEELPEETNEDRVPSKFDQQNQTPIEQPQEQTIVIH